MKFARQELIRTRFSGCRRGFAPDAARALGLFWLLALCGMLPLVLLLCLAFERLGGTGLLLLFWILLLFILTALYILDHLEAYSAAVEEKNLLLRQNRAYQAEFDLLRQSERQSRALRHDLKNHLAVLREYVALGRMDKVEQYLNTFDRRLARPGFVHTGNPDIDSILNYKLAQAEEAGARLELDVALPEGFAANAFDLNVILGNLLDNAVEALAGSGDKWIALSLQADRGVFVCRIANSYDGLTRQTAGPEGPAYRSRKAGEGHGLGLGIVRRMAERYHGALRIDSAGTTFTVEVILYLDP